MGSSSQHYRDIAAAASTEDWDNVSTNSIAAPDVYWLKETRPPGGWNQVFLDLGWFWDLHVYGMASLFTILSVLCLLTLLRLNAQLSRRPHLSSLNIFIGVLATSRFIVLFSDPYGSRQVLPAVLLQLLWDLGYPCLMSAFALLQLSFVHTNQVKMTRFNDESTVTIIITFHFCLIITSGVLGALKHSLRIVWLLTQVAFIIWGVFLCLSSLLGCLKLLRSIVRMPMQVFRQVDPGYEINSIMSMGNMNMFTEQAQDLQLQPVSHQPRIRITDVNEHTYSYASEASLANIRDQKDVCPKSPQHAEEFPLSIIPPASPTHWSTLKKKKDSPNSPREDPALMKPLLTLQMDESNKDAPTQTSFSTVRALKPSPTTTMQQPLSPHLAQIRIEDIQFDARKLKRQSQSRLEKQLRRLVCTSGLGVALCLLKAYDIFGPHGLLYHSGRRPMAVLPWFCFQTMSRVVEFIMAYAMVVMSQQSLNSHHYHYNN